MPEKEFTLTVEAGRPAAPTNVRAVAGDGSITVLWDLVTEGGRASGTVLPGSSQANESGGRAQAVYAQPRQCYYHTCKITNLNNGQQYANIRVTVRAGPSATEHPVHRHHQPRRELHPDPDRGHT